MLTQEAVRTKLESIADEVSQEPGIYYELFSRLYSARVQHWIRSVPGTDAALIAHIAENDPAYLGDIESEIEMPDPVFPSYQAPREPLFNPNWDVSY